MSRPVIVDTTPSRLFEFGAPGDIPPSAIEQIAQREDRERMAGMRVAAWFIAFDIAALAVLAMTFVCFNH